MAEATVWTGSSSQLKNLGAFIGAGLLSLAIIIAAAFLQNWWILLGLFLPALFALVQFLKVSCREYRLTSERLLITEGILSKTTDTLELYRVKDLRMTQPLLLRIFSLENIELVTSDKTDGAIVVDFVPKAAGLGDHFRNHVEACRKSKGTREIELE